MQQVIFFYWYLLGTRDPVLMLKWGLLYLLMFIGCWCLILRIMIKIMLRGVMFIIGILCKVL